MFGCDACLSCPAGLKLPGFAARGKNDQPVIVRAIDKAPRTGDEREVGEAIRRRLRTSAGDRPTAVDLSQNRRIGGLPGRVDCRLDNGKVNGRAAAHIMRTVLRLPGSPGLTIRPDGCPDCCSRGQGMASPGWPLPG